MGGVAGVTRAVGSEAATSRNAAAARAPREKKPRGSGGGRPRQVEAMAAPANRCVKISIRLRTLAPAAAGSEKTSPGLCGRSPIRTPAVASDARADVTAGWLLLTAGWQPEKRRSLKNGAACWPAFTHGNAQVSPRAGALHPMNIDARAPARVMLTDAVRCSWGVAGSSPAF